jgi:glutamate 5-kinase
MNIAEILTELRSKRDAIGEAIMALERLAISAAKRRERPIKLITRPTKGRTFSAEARQRMAEAQRRRWAAKRQEAELKSTVDNRAVDKLRVRAGAELHETLS